MRKSDLLRALQTEIRRHTFDTFVFAQGGNGVVTPGCPACRKRLFTMANFGLIRTYGRYFQRIQSGGSFEQP
jgi:hypothetical protein